ncbi:ABC transporter ATP-binding protein [Chelatococcus asaccharovorans]|uniref:ABC transporter ATP-binding protein n=1 Tax=Chelatococcus asaccharovorans TaxID=28210 RepID=UPI00224C670D|nr:sn-glycerol-3-phosphate ABC transporter ATP-binding protein UgpC [Chelatococcus asaccharovorans]CAH1653935.1 sn-glycerol 3-phosphate ABC transporter ATP binding subunit [Chelatococcus asaccharovorans]CAH1685895.1 sn-glycerol 3-phosphate ABC transporter ATP binding subunit [Chelatococcus asaccharovorans]
MAELTLKNVVKRYGNIEIVHGISLDIKDGEFVVLVGPSGCGKSTTLRMIAGLESLSAGTISIGDRVVNTLEPKDRNIAMVFQNYALYPHMTVFRNIAFGLHAAKLPKDAIDKKVREAAKLLGLSELLERRPNELSGGQRQRVAMGRAIVRDPTVFLFDEPLSNLDAQLRGQMRTEIKRLHQSIGTTIVYVTHDQVEAMTLADRIVIMRDGRIEQVGTPLDVFHAPVSTFVAGFIGTPTMNLIALPVRQSGGNATLAFSDQDVLPLSAEGVRRIGNRDRVTVGIRPDDLVITPADAARERQGTRLEGTVVVAEPLGVTTQVIARVGDHELVGMADGRFVPQAGAPVALTCDVARLHLFDPETQRSLAS